MAVELKLLISLLAGASSPQGSADLPVLSGQDTGSTAAPLVAADLVLVCFSYTKDLPVLLTSLESLRRSCERIAFDYVLVSDRKAPFTRDQIRAFEERLGRAIEHRTTPFAHGHRGIRVFLNELTIFHGLASRLKPSAWIVKIDSDLLFLGPQLFDFLKSDQEHDHVYQDVRSTLPIKFRSWPSYSQGGCYSFRASLLNAACQGSALYAFMIAFWEFAKRGKIVGFCNLAEDFMVHFYLSRFWRHPLSTTFFVPCPFRQQRVSREPAQFPSVMHFERCAEQMQNYYADWLAGKSTTQQFDFRTMID